MNELNMNTHDLDCSHDLASADLEQLLLSCLPRKKLLPLVKERVKLAIAQFAQRAPLSASTSDATASANVVDYLRGASAIPLAMELCTLMARVGFDKALFTYGNADGVPVGYAEGSWLLKFVEHAENEPARPPEAAWLQLLGKDPTKH
jgi:hypothetical protein